MTVTGDESRRARLLLSAFLCRPGAGSESGSGWNRALQAAEEFDTWVLCDEHLNGNLIRNYLQRHGPIAGLEFIFVPCSRWERFLRRLPAVCYVAYNLWHRHAFHAARRLHERLHFDLTHKLTLNTFREPGYLWCMDLPFVWGPFGGTQIFPWRCLTEAGFTGSVSEGFRNLVNIFQLCFNKRVRRAGQKAAVLLAASSTNQKDFDRWCKCSSSRMLDVGVSRSAPAPRNYRQRQGPLRILWSGDFRPGKALSLLIKALAQLPDDVPYELRILGRGPLENRWRRLARRQGVQPHATWMGFLPHEEAMRQYDWADLFVFTSLRDTSGTVIVEALAAGVPVVCLDHQGAHDIVNKQCGVTVPVTTPRQIVRQLSQVIASLAHDRDRLSQLSQGALDRVQRYLWSRQGAAMAAIYHRVLNDVDRTHEDRARALAAPFSTQTISAAVTAVTGMITWT